MVRDHERIAKDLHALGAVVSEIAKELKIRWKAAELLLIGLGLEPRLTKKSNGRRISALRCKRRREAEVIIKRSWLKGMSPRMCVREAHSKTQLKVSMSTVHRLVKDLPPRKCTIKAYYVGDAGDGHYVRGDHCGYSGGAQ